MPRAGRLREPGKNPLSAARLHPAFHDEKISVVA